LDCSLADEIVSAFTALREAAVARDADGVEDAIRQLEFFIVEDGYWRDELLEGIKPLWSDRQFLQISSSLLLARLVAENWHALSALQRNELRPLLSQAFEHFGDSIGMLVLAEIYGERYADDEAFAVLDRLSAAGTTLPARALATYGLGRLARIVGSGDLHSRAIARLTQLADSAEVDVRKEARDALDKIRK
jgi:hypothetical protein